MFFDKKPRTHFCKYGNSGPCFAGIGPENSVSNSEGPMKQRLSILNILN